MNTVYIIARAKHWKDAHNQGSYTHSTIHKSLAEQGFIHGSTEAEALEIVNQRYRAEDGLVLLGIDTDKLKSPLKHEAVLGGHIYPHIYGPINLDAVTTVRRFTKTDDGGFKL